MVARDFLKDYFLKTDLVILEKKLDRERVNLLDVSQ